MHSAVFSRRFVKIIAAVALVALVCTIMPILGGGTQAKAYTGSALGVQDEPRIKQVVWPTIGNPAIVNNDYSLRSVSHNMLSYPPVTILAGGLHERRRIQQD